MQDLQREDGIIPMVRLNRLDQQFCDRTKKKVVELVRGWVVLWKYLFTPYVILCLQTCRNHVVHVCKHDCLV